MKKMLLGSVLILSACASPATFANRCQQYGFQPGTVQFANCVQGESRAYSQALQNLGQQISAPPPQMQTTSTTCSPFGNSIRCTTM